MADEDSRNYSERPLNGLVRAIEPEGGILPTGLPDVCGHQFIGVAYLK